MRFIKYFFSILIICFMYGCIEEEKTSYFKLNETMKTNQFEITITDVELTDSVNVGSKTSNLTQKEGMKYLILTFFYKNIDTETRYMTAGELIAIKNGKKYEFDKTEYIMKNGWRGLSGDSNPFETKKERIVYLLPNELEDAELYYIPYSARNTQFHIGIAKNFYANKNTWIKPKEKLKGHIFEVALTNIRTTDKVVGKELNENLYFEQDKFYIILNGIFKNTDLENRNLECGFISFYANDKKIEIFDEAEYYKDFNFFDCGEISPNEEREIEVAFSVPTLTWLKKQGKVKKDEKVIVTYTPYSAKNNTSFILGSLKY